MTWGLFSEEKLTYERAFRVTPVRTLVQPLVRGIQNNSGLNKIEA